MNIKVRRRNNTFIGMKAFRLANTRDFPSGSVEAEQMDEIEAVLALIEQYGGDQSAGFGNARFSFNGKAVCRKNLRDALREISTIAGTMGYQVEGIELIFRIPKNLNDVALLATANAFAGQAAQYQPDFIRYGLKPSFIEDLQAAIDEFEASLTPPEMAEEARVEATARIDEAIRRGMIARSVLKGVLKVKFKNDTGKLRAWLNASHLERDNPDDDGDPSKENP
jgi:hypothetical protein